MASRFLPSCRFSTRPSWRWPPALFSPHKPSPQHPDHHHHQPLSIYDLACSPSPTPAFSPPCLSSSPSVRSRSTISFPSSTHHPSGHSQGIRLCFSSESPASCILNGHVDSSIPMSREPNGIGPSCLGTFTLQQPGFCAGSSVLSKVNLSSLASPLLSKDTTLPPPSEEVLAREDPTCQPNLFSQPYTAVSDGAAEGFLHDSQPNQADTWTETLKGDEFEQNGSIDDVAYDQNHGSMPMRFGEPADVYIAVKAFFISRRINLKTLAEEHFTGTIVSRNNLIIKWKDRPSGCPPVTAKPGMPALSSWSSARYMVAFNYGSVVFFNFGENEEDECLEVIRRHCTDQCQEAKNDDFDVLVRPTLEGWSQAGHDKVILKRLDVDNIRIVSSILGQSIALDHYGRKVDEMVKIFSELNQGMEKTGTFTMERKKLFQHVAAANTTLADVILRIGILERSDVAWKDANYAALWEFLRDEFELDQRFESFDFKLEIIQHNVRFFLEVLQNRKSDTLEWTIILLIAGEICVGLYDIFHTAGYI